MIGTGSMSDPYMPLELETEYTRKALLIIEKYGCGVALQTKSDRVLRDLEILKRINEKTKAVVQMTLTTADDSLCRIIEPNVCNTRRRIEVLEQMRQRDIPTVVWLTPILPFINDTEENIRAILEACVRTRVKGIICYDMGLTLRDGDREYYYAALDRHFPGLTRKYIETYGNSYELPSPHSSELMALFKDICSQNNILSTPQECFAYLQELPEKNQQLSMFDYLHK